MVAYYLNTANNQECKDDDSLPDQDVHAKEAPNTRLSLHKRVESVALKPIQKLDHEVVLMDQKMKSRFCKMSKILKPTRTKPLSDKERKYISVYVSHKSTYPLTKDQRKQLWMLGLGVKALMKQNPGYYEALSASESESSLGPSSDSPTKSTPIPDKSLHCGLNPCFYQIELDLHRTFSSDADEEAFTQEDQNMLRRVLAAYIKRNPTVGYCQGMNFLVAILISQLSEEEAFWALCSIIENILPNDYFNLMTGVLLDVKCLESLVQQYHPDLYEHLEESGIKLESFVTQWFVCLFSTTFKKGTSTSDQKSGKLTVLEIWDYFIAAGIAGIFRVALAVFDQLKDTLMECNDVGDLFMLFKPALEEVPSLKQLSSKINREVKELKIEKLRRMHRKEVYMQYEERHYKNGDTRFIRNKHDLNWQLEETVRGKFLSKFYLFNGLSKLRGNGVLPKHVLENFDQEVVLGTSCDVSWPICLYDLFYKSRIQRHFVFKTQQKLDIIDDHFKLPDRDTDNEFVEKRPKSDNNDNHKIIDCLFEEAKNTNDNEGQCNEDNDSSDEVQSNHLLIERNKHICQDDHFEQKFKLLYSNKNSEFFISALQNVYQDLGDLSYRSKAVEFKNAVDMLVERFQLFDVDSCSSEYFEQMKKLNYKSVLKQD